MRPGRCALAGAGRVPAAGGPYPSFARRAAHLSRCAALEHRLPYDGRGQNGTDPPLTRRALDIWLSDPGVLRHLAYTVLYYDNDRLAGHLLGLPDPPPPDALAELSRRVFAVVAAPPPDPPALPHGWNWVEAAVILWRYRNALYVEQILQRDDCSFSAEALAALIERIAACFPFSEEMQSLLTVLGARGRRALADKGLWQRLAFQYRYVDDLSHHDVRDRTQPAYRHVAPTDQPEITLAMLNAWLSSERLLKRLERMCRGEAGGEDDD